jgi:transcriptional regulator with XRE-family HTH domain
MSMKQWMKRTHYTRDEVASDLGRSPSWISKIANGKREPSEDFITDFFFAYGQEATIEAFDANGNGKAAA